MSNERKMSGKQPVSGGFDLDSFVGGAEPEAVEAPKLAVEPSVVSKRTKPQPKPSKARSGPKSQHKAKEKENLTSRVQVRMTDEEFSRLEAKVGMVPVSKFLRKFLQDNGLI